MAHKSTITTKASQLTEVSTNNPPMVLSTIMSTHSEVNKFSAETVALINRVNTARLSSSLGKLTLSKTLQELAQAHATSLSKEPKLRPSAAGLAVPYGENVHRSKLQCPNLDAFKAWSKKTCARTNLYSPYAAFAGIGIAQANGHVFVVMMFTKLNPDKGDGSELGSEGSCTSISTLLLSDFESDAVTKTQVLGAKEIIGKENGVSVEKKLMPANKALDIAHDAFNFMNGARRDADVSYLRWDDGLYRQALAHTKRIFHLGRLVHSGIHKFENVTSMDLGSSKKAGKLLMEKLLRRRENMLSSSFEYCAIAVVGDGKKAYATQLFSRKRVE